MKKPNAKAKRQQVKKAQKGHGIWVTPRANRVSSVAGDRDASVRGDVPVERGEVK